MHQILLWPFGGICFTKRNPNVHNTREKLKAELKIVWGGPLTHVPQSTAWLLLLTMIVAAFGISNANVSAT